MSENCGNCKFWHEIPGTTQRTPGGLQIPSGSCRRHPPQLIVPTPQGISIMNPQTSKDWYCGEHELNFRV